LCRTLKLASTESESSVSIAERIEAQMKAPGGRVDPVLAHSFMASLDCLPYFRLSDEATWRAVLARAAHRGYLSFKNVIGARSLREFQEITFERWRKRDEREGVVKTFSYVVPLLTKWNTYITAEERVKAIACVLAPAASAFRMVGISLSEAPIPHHVIQQDVGMPQVAREPASATVPSSLDLLSSLTFKH
jgi:hypothetical protein